MDTLVREALAQAVLTAQWGADQQTSSTSINSSNSSSHNSNTNSSNNSSNNTNSHNSSTSTLDSHASSATTGHSCPIVRLRGLFETETCLVLEMELMSGQDLFDQMRARGVMGEAAAAQLISSVLRAAHFCSRRGLAHRYALHISGFKALHCSLHSFHALLRAHFSSRQLHWNQSVFGSASCGSVSIVNGVAARSRIPCSLLLQSYLCVEASFA